MTFYLFPSDTILFSAGFSVALKQKKKTLEKNKGALFPAIFLFQPYRDLSPAKMVAMLLKLALRESTPSWHKLVASVIRRGPDAAMDGRSSFTLVLITF